jgi:hypothetical protein
MKRLKNRVKQKSTGHYKVKEETSQPKISLEKPPQSKGGEATIEMRELKSIAKELEQIQHGFLLVKEIREGLETALKRLSDR